MVIPGITTATVLPAAVQYINHKTAVQAPTTAIIPPVQTMAVYAGYTKAKAAAAMVVISRPITHQPLRRRLEVTLLHHQEVLQAEAVVAAAAAVAEADHHVAEDKRRETANVKRKTDILVPVSLYTDASRKCIT